MGGVGLLGVVLFLVCSVASQPFYVATDGMHFFLFPKQFNHETYIKHKHETTVYKTN
jgi:hypothetical protein